MASNVRFRGAADETAGTRPPAQPRVEVRGRRLRGDSCPLTPGEEGSAWGGCHVKANLGDGFGAGGGSSLLVTLPVGDGGAGHPRAASRRCLAGF